MEIHNREKYPLDKIKTGFQRFYKEHGRYPKAVEMDECPYLCSSRWIQYKYGGLKKFKKKLGINITDYGSGPTRSEVSKKFNKLALQAESDIKQFLLRNYGELCIHEEIKIGDSRLRADFFVYAQENFVVDVFNTYTLKNLIANINIKLRKYKNYAFKIYFVVTGAEFNQMEIDNLMSSKINKLKQNMKCLTSEEFKKECLENIPPLKIKFRYTSRLQLKFNYLTEY